MSVNFASHGETTPEWRNAFYHRAFFEEEEEAIASSNALSVLAKEAANNKGWDSYLLVETVNVRGNGPHDRLAVRSVGYKGNQLQDSIRFIDDRETSLSEAQKTALGARAVRLSSEILRYDEEGEPVRRGPLQKAFYDLPRETFRQLYAQLETKPYNLRSFRAAEAITAVTAELVLPQLAVVEAHEAAFAAA